MKLKHTEIFMLCALFLLKFFDLHSTTLCMKKFGLYIEQNIIFWFLLDSGFSWQWAIIVTILIITYVISLFYLFIGRLYLKTNQEYTFYYVFILSPLILVVISNYYIFLFERQIDWLIISYRILLIVIDATVISFVGLYLINPLINVIVAKTTPNFSERFKSYVDIHKILHIRRRLQKEKKTWKIYFDSWRWKL